jgi:hypothetical protein
MKCADCVSRVKRMMADCKIGVMVPWFGAISRVRAVFTILEKIGFVTQRESGCPGVSIALVPALSRFLFSRKPIYNGAYFKRRLLLKLLL